MNNPDDKKPQQLINSSFPPSDGKNSRRKILENVSGDSDGVLAKLFHIICYDLTNNQHYSGSAWKRLMDRYLDDLVKQDPSVNRQNERGNFTKALNAPKMTWRTFFKGLILLRFRKIRFIIEGERDNGVVTIHQSTISFANRDGDEDINFDVRTEKDDTNDKEQGKE